MRALLVGPDRSIEAALEGQGFETRRLDGHPTRDALDAAGVEDAALLVLTDVAEATVIPLAKEANPAIRVVVYSTRSMPEFVRGQVDLAVAPGVLAPDAIAEELAGGVT